MDPTNPRKKTGGKIEIKVLMRQPLNKEHIVKKSHQWMVVAFGGVVSNQVSVHSSIQTKSTDKDIMVPTVNTIDPSINENEILSEPVLQTDKMFMQPSGVSSETGSPSDIIHIQRLETVLPADKKTMQYSEVSSGTALHVDKIPMQPSGSSGVSSDSVLPAYKNTVAPTHIQSPPAIDIDSLEIQFFTYISS
jgi:hypothetical protein